MGDSQGVGNFIPAYDKNGSVTSKTTKVTSTQEVLETVTYDYNLQNRLVKATTIDYVTPTTTVVAYKYNADGVRVQKIDDPDGTPTTTNYLIDTYNHTGYAQVLEESGATLKTYTIGDDILTQATDSGAGQHLLYDGHGSTRQLAEYDTDVTIVDSFSYDGYGVLLQDDAVASSNPGKVGAQQTSLLYAGEHFDTDTQQYYLRARWYNPLSGLFNRIDPYSGNTQDPQSLHKYLYAHCNPVNGIDPSGLSVLGAVGAFVASHIWTIVAVIAIATIAFKVYNFLGGSTWRLGLGHSLIKNDDISNMMNGLRIGRRVTHFLTRVPDILDPSYPQSMAAYWAAAAKYGVYQVGTVGEGIVGQGENLSPGCQQIVNYFETWGFFLFNQDANPHRSPAAYHGTDNPQYVYDWGGWEMPRCRILIHLLIEEAERRNLSVPTDIDLYLQLSDIIKDSSKETVLKEYQGNWSQ